MGSVQTAYKTGGGQKENISQPQTKQIPPLSWAQISFSSSTSHHFFLASPCIHSGPIYGGPSKEGGQRSDIVIARPPCLKNITDFLLESWENPGVPPQLCEPPHPVFRYRISAEHRNTVGWLVNSACALLPDCLISEIESIKTLSLL